MTFFIFFWRFIDRTINQLIQKMMMMHVDVFSCLINIISNSYATQMLNRSPSPGQDLQLWRNFMRPSGIMWTVRLGPYHHRLYMVSLRMWRRCNSLQIQEEEKLWAVRHSSGQWTGNWNNKYEVWLNKDCYFHSAASGWLMMNQFHVQYFDCVASVLAQIIYCGFLASL